jgi:chromosome partitioning protein
MAKRSTTAVSTKIVAIVNNKGGVGKTTATVHIGHALAQLGHSVLCVDMDEQANLVQYFFSRRKVNQLKQAQNGVPLPVEKHEGTNVDVLMLSSYIGVKDDYVAAIKQYEGKYDYILLDSPPALDERTHACLAASTGMLIPTEAGALAFSGTATLIALAEEYGTALYGIFLNLYDDRVSTQRAFYSTYQTNFAEQFLPIVVNRNAIFPNSAMRSITGFDYKKNGHKDLSAYKTIAEIVVKGGV